nr:hypothetical protein [Streptomyces hokutonensis]
MSSTAQGSARSVARVVSASPAGSRLTATNRQGVCQAPVTWGAPGPRLQSASSSAGKAMVYVTLPAAVSSVGCPRWQAG